MPSFDRQAFKDAFNRRVQEVRDADNKKRKSELRETHNNHAVHIKQDPDDLDSPLHSIESTPKHSQSKSAKKCDDTTAPVKSSDATLFVREDTIAERPACSSPADVRPVKGDSDSASRAAPDSGLGLADISDPDEHKKFHSKDGPVRWGPIKKKRKTVATGFKTKEAFDPWQGQATKLRDCAWYAKVNNKAKHSRKDVQGLSYIRDLVKKCYDTGHEIDAVNALRQEIHKIEFSPFLNSEKISEVQITIKKSRVLDAEGLPEIIDNRRGLFPPDVVADASVLFGRWVEGNFDPNLLRGIQVFKGTLNNGKKRTNYTLKDDTKYPFKKSAHVVGANGLHVGQWWPLRIAAIRDGCHGEQEAGISGSSEKGVFAICMAEGGYLDEDNGDTIEYCGTGSDNETPTRHTQLMLDTAAKVPSQPIRLLRAVSKKSKYAPSHGMRYDGLYEITEFELKDKDTAMYRFSMRRLPGQDPIRHKGPEARPTPEEKQAMQGLKGLMTAY